MTTKSCVPTLPPPSEVSHASSVVPSHDCDDLLFFNPEQRRRGEHQEVDMQLPSNSGYISYQPPDEQWGQEKTLRALNVLGILWWARHNFLQTGQWNAPRIQIGDISYEGGGDHPQHASHHLGVDVDIRILANDNREMRCKITDACYNRELTQELIDILLMQAESPEGTPVQFIFTADRGLQGPPSIVRYDNAHYDHIHVRFDP
jgi:hypothetical protein